MFLFETRIKKISFNNKTRNSLGHLNMPSISTTVVKKSTVKFVELDVHLILKLTLEF